MSSPVRRLLAAGLVLAIVAVVATALYRKGDGRTAPGRPAGAVEVTAPARAEDLAPLMRALGGLGRIPDKLVVELARPVTVEWGPEAGVPDDTRLDIEPDVPGTLTMTGPSTLAFTPNRGFDPGTEYRVELESVAVGETVVRGERREGWTHSFTTPAFELQDSRVALHDRRGATIELAFTGPVDASAVASRTTVTLDGRVLPVARSGSSRLPHLVELRVQDGSIEVGDRLELSIAAGVPLAWDADHVAPAASATLPVVAVPASTGVRFLAAYPAEGSSGYYVTVMCDDGAVETKQYVWDPVGEQSFDGVSTRCVLADEDARESIRVDPPVGDVTVSQAHGGFRVFGAFRRGTYTLGIAPGARTVDGSVVREGYEASFSVPARSPSVSFLARGRYASRRDWRSLPVRHLNLDQASLTVRLVPPENLVFWMSDDGEAATERNSRVVSRTTLALRGQPDEPATTHVDVASLVPQLTKGLVELTIEGGAARASTRLVLTDLQLVAKRSTPDPASPWRQQIRAWALDAGSAEPVRGVDVRLVTRSGLLLASGTTRADGGVVLESPADSLDAEGPFAILASRGADMSYLAFDEVMTEVEEEQVSGESATAPLAYRASIHADRGVYRPGETAHLAVILRTRDYLAPPPGMPVVVEIVDPRGQVLRRDALTVNAAGWAVTDVTFADFATTGRHEVHVDVGEARVATHRFHVEEFVPERMEVELGTRIARALAGEPVTVAIAARYLFGGVPKGHPVELTCTLEPADFEPAGVSGYQFGAHRPDGNPHEPVPLGSSSGVLDAEGRAELTCPTPAGGWAGPGRVIASAAVSEAGSGRASIGQTAVPVHPARHYVGLSSRTATAGPDADLVVDGIVVDWDGRPVTTVTEVEVQLTHLEDEMGWWYDESEGTSSRRRYQRPVPEGTTRVAVEDGKFTVTLRPMQSAVGYLVRASVDGARTDLRVEGTGWDYWWGEEMGERAERTPAPSKPTWLEIRTPERAEVGRRIEVSFDAPWRGRVLLTAETDGILASEWREVSPGPVAWSFELRDFVPNVYVTALLVKPGRLDSDESFVPDRAYGVASVPVEPRGFTMDARLTAPSEIRSQSRLSVTLDVGATEGPTFATIAVVDEGVLSVTKFADPDPVPAIFARRALGVATFETIGWSLLLPPADGSGTAGGDEALALGRVQAVKPVALWSGLREVPPSGKLVVTFDVPEYTGAVRVMAVVADPKRLGHASTRVLVRDPLLVQVTLPRFLVQDDAPDVPVFVTNLSGSAREVEVDLVVERVGDADGGASVAPPVKLVGDERKSLRLADGAGDMALFRLRVPAVAGVARLIVRARSGDLESSATALVPVLPSGPRERTLQRIELAEGTTDLVPLLEGWVPMSERTTAWVTSNPHADAFSHLPDLIRYPYGCIEQTCSVTRPLLVARHLLPALQPELASGEVEAMVSAGIERILSMQTPSGGFAYWPGGLEPAYWSTANATHLLLDAKARHHHVPQDRIDAALSWMEERITNFYEKGRSESDWYSKGAEPYMHYVLAGGGRPRKARAEALLARLSAGPRDGEVAEQIYMLQAALHMAGDRRHEAALRSPDLSPVLSDRRDGWTFYSDRRRRGFMLATHVDLFGADAKDAAGQRLAGLVAESLRGHRGAWYTTQELVWSVSGLGAWVAGGATFAPPTLRSGDRDLEPAPQRPGSIDGERTWHLTRASERPDLDLHLPEKGEGRVFLVLASEGVREGSTWELGGHGLSVDRRHVAADGTPLDLGDGTHALGHVVHVVLTIANTSGERISNVALVDRIPAGWEIENPRLGRGTTVEWIDQEALWNVDHLDVRDDRLEVFGHLEAGESRQVVYAVRAVASGRFTIPPVEAEAMYDPDTWARQPGRVLSISGPWSPVAQ